MGQIKCVLCSSKKTKVQCLLHDKDFFPREEFKFVKCINCGLIFIQPLPNVEQIDAYYTERYIEEHLDEFLSIKILNPYFMRANQVKKFKKDGKIIDVGCGRGYFLALMDDGNWEIHGVEISRPGARIAKDKLGSQRVYTDNFSYIDLPSNYFDVATFWRVLDHLLDPLEDLKKANKILKKGGLLFLEVPSASSLQRIIFGSDWYGYDSARHLYKFAPKTLKKLLSMSGFKLIKISPYLNNFDNLIWFKLSLIKYFKIYSSYSKYTTDVANNMLSRIARFNLNLICFIMASTLAFLGSGDNLFAVAEKY